MNKMSAKETEITLDQVEQRITVINSLDDYTPLSAQDTDKIIRAARVAQTEVATQIFSAVAKAIGNAFRAVQNGISAARTYEELSRLSDRGLANIGLRREDIGRMVYLGSESRSTMAELKVCGYDTKVGHPSNNHASKYAA
ncbi:MAG TPA: DUF1127 domain-containing protein [Rhodospirillales bacterium]|jgi:uncharacterized protein YjiS (DUF1127 family)|nr:DUF1127 domain-containing protein [Rhodospirillales bacterium]